MLLRLVRFTVRKHLFRPSQPLSLPPPPPPPLTCLFSHHSSNTPIGSTLARSNYEITRLSREGKLFEARRLFDRMPRKDVVTWTSLITAYVKCGCLDDARRLFDDPSAARNVVTWTSMLSGYARQGMLDRARDLFERMPERNVVSYNTMISAYADAARIDDACALFNEMPARNVVSYNAIVTALARSGRASDARAVFDRMPERDVVSWTAIIAGLSQNGRVDEARDLFDRAPDRNVISWNAMLSGYAQNGRLGEAMELFRRMPARDLQSWNAMVAGLIGNGDLGRARELFDEMRVRNVVTWTSMIEGYVREGRGYEAVRTFLLMLRDGIRANRATFVSVLGACSGRAGLCEGRQVHQMISKTQFEIDPHVVSALISMYSKCGEISVAREMFDRVECKDMVAWNGMIAAYAHHGCGREAMKLFEEMRMSRRLTPNEATYVGLLSACSHSGLVDEGLECFSELVNDKSVEVREEHYACLVDLCGRAGRLNEAAEVVGRMKGNCGSASVWGALLGGCSYHGEERVGEVAAERLMEVEPENEGTYMLLSNIYASKGQWKEAARVRLRMKEKGLKKRPGCSWIEVDNRVHVFVVMDKTHCCSDVIYRLIGELHCEMKGACEDCRFVEGDFL
ncbi:Pentatricopeptide repeat-containing protein [Acorus gramineus]|uniref:Pentatricopeptide repeat-containing protein n=1 Tax=Acorus gramineus TaxID=55184 RepID=A0AAV9BI37_ACOGR|nr:Pentatricopeptide repeat-containing protein [Acorus gramineus]